MADFERYPIFMSAKQNLFSPSCPISVSRYQISGDVQTGRRLLQVRLINLSRKVVTGVFLRIVCLDEREQMLATMRTVPMTELYVPRGGVFGDQRIITLYSARTVCTEITVERVRFADGTSWNEPDEPDTLRIPAASPVQFYDTAYAALSERARAAGVHNEYYFEQQGAYWRCTCGVANSNWSAQCGYCGASREWLSAHMDAAQLMQPQEPAALQPPQEPAPVAEEEPAEQPVTPSFDLDDGLPVFVPAAPYPPAAYSDSCDFPPVQTEPEASKKSKAGKVVLTIAIALILLAAAGFFAYRYLMPYLRYNQAGDLAAKGSYDEAIAIYTELGTFSDSREQISCCRYQQGLELMRDGKYEEAFAVFAELDTYDESRTRAAECLYSQGVLAYNNGDADTALGFADKLQAEYPEYEGTKDLLQCCAYSKGTQALNEGDYETALDWFTKADGYSDSQNGIDECNYQIAVRTKNDGDYVKAVELFRALNGYRDSSDLLNASMYAYVKENLSAQDSTTLEYLQALVSEDYQDSEELYESLTAWNVKIVLNTNKDDATTAATELDDMNALQLHCAVTGGLADAELKILVVYTLPDKTTGNALLREASFKNGDSACIAWSSFNITAPKSDGTLTLKFYNSDNGDELCSATINYKAKKAP